MKLKIADYCIRCGLCEDMFPDLFQRNFEEHRFDVLYEEIPEEMTERAKMAIMECAVGAISEK